MREMQPVSHSSYPLDVEQDVVSSLSAFRFHVVPPDQAYIEGLGERGFRLPRANHGVQDSRLDPYFVGVYALAFERGLWTGAPDPRRDGRV